MELGEQRDEVELAGANLLQPSGDDRAGDKPHPRVQPSREVVVDVEQVAEPSGRLEPRVAGEPAIGTNGQWKRTGRRTARAPRHLPTLLSMTGYSRE